MSNRQDIFAVEVAMFGFPQKTVYSELTRTIEAQDIDGHAMVESLPDLMRRAADMLTEQLADGTLSLHDLFSVNVHKVAVRLT